MTREVRAEAIRQTLAMLGGDSVELRSWAVDAFANASGTRMHHAYAYWRAGGVPHSVTLLHPSADTLARMMLAALRAALEEP